MSFHFAYPNVLPRQGTILGCGRYTVFASDETPPSEYVEVKGAPNTPNKNGLKRAVQLLASDSYDSTKVLFHKQDQQKQKYQGDSLDLAWFLAHILRTRKLRYRMETDIWCTGVLQVDGSGPHLLDVDSDGFYLKLEAFLDPANTDTLFIIPLANLEPRTRQLCRESGAVTVRLENNGLYNLKNIKGKTVLAVAADDLQLLLDQLFIPPAANNSGGRKTRKFVVILLLIGSVGFTIQPFIFSWLKERNIISKPFLQEPVLQPSADPIQPARPYRAADIISEIHQGDFYSVQPFLQSRPDEDSRELQQLRYRINSSFPVQGEFQYMLAGGIMDKVVIEPGVRPPVLSHRDYYRYLIAMDTPPEALYLYLFQVDSSGDLTLLFPSTQFGTKNPVRPWQWPVFIPGAAGEWIYLDKLSDMSSEKPQEIVYLLSTPWPAKDIEQLHQQLLNDSENEGLKARLLTHITLRQQLGLPAIHFIRWSFSHGK